MVRLSILNVAAIATLLLGAEAGPCKPKTTAATSLAETTSTFAADTTTTSIASTTVIAPTDTTTTILGETTTTEEAESTTTTEVGSTTVPEGESTTTTLEDTTTTTQAESTTTEAESTTTTAAAGCVETQLFVNPNFDDSSSGIAPWTSNAALTQSQPQSGTNALSAVFSNGQPVYNIKQTLQNLNGNYVFSYYYRVVSVSPGADYVCNIQLSVGSTTVYGYMEDNAGGWKTANVNINTGDDTIAQADAQLAVSCLGEFVRIEVDIDTLALTKVCAE
ncbi:hypothetical protein H9Q72_013531 [Fusarium xylarioides]|uniref:CBM-cenC domain-containing protein n=1 Tax=Fusarium xylarioides TaxID=221167 RepID=A0A9P7HLJ5_9HYPO|nr:hypothetical protein H9Q72_013531 [Fusarium xylarioides]